VRAWASSSTINTFSSTFTFRTATSSIHSAAMLEQARPVP
jgi:hypothetical protein